MYRWTCEEETAIYAGKRKSTVQVGGKEAVGFGQTAPRDTENKFRLRRPGHGRKS